MSSAVSSPGSTVPSFAIVLTGKIEGIREISGDAGVRYLHKIRLRASDSYQHPPVVQVRHTSKLGKVGDERADFEVRLGGYPERWKTADGMRERVVNTLDVI